MIALFLLELDAPTQVWVEDAETPSNVLSILSLLASVVEGLLFLLQLLFSVALGLAQGFFAISATLWSLITLPALSALGWLLAPLGVGLLGVVILVTLVVIALALVA